MDLKAVAKHYGVTVADVLSRGALVKATLDDAGTFTLFKNRRPASFSSMVAAVKAEVPSAVKKFLPVEGPGELPSSYLPRMVKAVRDDPRLVEAKVAIGAEDVTKIDGALPKKVVDVEPILEEPIP